MANIEKTVHIIFSGHADELFNIITGINQGLELFEKILHGVLDPLAQVAEGVMELDQTLKDFALTLGKEAIDAFRDYEDACVDLKRLMGDQIEMWEDAENAVMHMSEEYGESATQIMRTAGEFKRAGFDMERTMKMTEGAVRLLITGNTDLGTATRALIQIFKGYQFEASKVTEVVDSMLRSSLDYATNIEKLGIGVSEISRIMKNMGFTFQETIGQVVPIIEVFQSGEEAATAVKTAFARLTSGAAPVGRAFTQLGVDVKHSNGQLKNGKELMIDVAEALKKYDTAQQQVIVNQITGNRQGQKLILTWGDLGKTVEVTENAMDAAGTTQEQLDQKMQTLDRTIKKFNESVNRLHIEIGKKLDPSFREVVKSATALINVLEKEVEIDTFKGLEEAITDTSTRLKKFISDVVNALPSALQQIDWSGLRVAWEDLMDTLEEFLRSIDVSKPEELNEVLQFVVDTMKSLVRVTNGMLEPLQNLVKDVLQCIEAFNNLSDEQKENIGTIVMHGKILKDLGVKVRGLMDTVAKVTGESYTNWQRFGEGIQYVDDKYVGFFKRVKLAFERQRLEQLQRLADLHSESETLKVELDKQAQIVEKLEKEVGAAYNRMKETKDNWRIAAEEGLEAVTEKIRKQNETLKISERTWQAHIDTARLLRGEIDEIPDVKRIKLEDFDSFKSVLDTARELGNYVLIELPDEKVILITPETADQQWEAIEKELEKIAEDKKVKVEPALDETAMDKVKKELDSALPPRRKVDILLEGVDQLRGQLKEVETGFKNALGEDGVRDVRITWQENERQDLMQNLTNLENELKALTKKDREPDAWEIRILATKLEETQKEVESFMKSLQEDVSGEPITADIRAEVNEEALRYAKQKLEEGIPDKIVVDILLAGVEQFKADTDRFEAETERVADALQAQVDVTVAEIETGAEEFSATMQSVSDSIGSTADAAADMFGSLVDYLKDAEKSAREFAEEMEKAKEDIVKMAEDIEEAFIDLFDSWEEGVDSIEDVQQSIKDLRIELEQIPDALEEIDDRLEEISEEIKDIDDELDKLYKEEEKRTKKVTRHFKERIEVLEEELDIEDDILDILNDQVSALEETEDLTEEEKERKERIKELEREKRELLREQRRLEEEKVALAERQTEIQEDLRTLLEDLKQILREIFKDTVTWTEELSSANKTFADIKEKLDILRSQGLIDKETYERNIQSAKEWQKILEECGNVDFTDPTTWSYGMRQALTDLGFDLDKVYEEWEKAQGVINKQNKIATQDARRLTKMVQQQLDMQDKLIDAQVKLMEKQGELIAAKTEALQAGDALIKVDGAGLQPELEAFMWKILETIQVRANAEYSEFLLGMSGFSTLQQT